ncbi:unnamed protein product [Plutella xylostella]|uniref:(diamondback moth) hypothetical protein n=1 Tax=Plutella xylostella TaxID=51655 RepID=A0A8S4GBB8_PLUXY|nr:unnamed protein product [Plutella xylostella]
MENHFLFTRRAKRNGINWGSLFKKTNDEELAIGTVVAQSEFESAGDRGGGCGARRGGGKYSAQLGQAERRGAGGGNSIRAGGSRRLEGRGAGACARAAARPLSLVERCPTGNVAPSAELRRTSDMSTVAKTSKYTYRSSGGGTTDVNIEYSADLSALSRLEDKIRLLHDDLESERELRQRVSESEMRSARGDGHSGRARAGRGLYKYRAPRPAPPRPGP